MLMAAKSELEDTRREHDRDVEALLDGIRETSREVKKLAVITEYFIPRDYLKMIDDHMNWNDDIGEWHLVSSKKLFFTDFVFVHLNLSVSLFERGVENKTICEL